MGILDQFSNMNPEQTQGLLAAAAQMLQQSGPSRTPNSFGQVFGGGLSAYQGATEASKRRKQEEEQSAQMAQMRDTQMRAAQFNLEREQQAQQQAQQMRQYEQEYAQGGPQAAPQSAMQQLNSTPQQSVPGMQAAEQGGQQAQPRDEYDERMNYARFLRGKGLTQQANAATLEALKFKRKFSTTPQVMEGPDGKLRNFQLSEDGGPAADVGLGVKPDIAEVNLNDRIEFINKNEALGKSMRRGVSPDATLVDSRAREFNAIQQDANNIARGEKQKTADMTKASQVASFDTMLGTLGRLSEHPGLKRSVGLYSAVPTVPGTDSANFQAELNTFQSQAFIPMVAQLKGMGALSDAEGKKLTAAVGALDPKMGEDAFRGSVGRIIGEMEDARARVSGISNARQVDGGEKTATLADIQATAKASGKTTAEVTAALRAKGYKIGGQ